MARARNIKPGIMDNEKLAECDPIARLLFTYLWMLADRSGRLEDRPRRIGVQALPYDDVDVNDLLQQLHDHEFILRYEANDTQYIQILNFEKHQSPHHKEKASTIPAPDRIGASTGQGECKPENNPKPAPPDSLIPDSLIPDSGATPVASPARGSRLPEDWEPPQEFHEAAKKIKPLWTAEKINSVGDEFRDYWIAKPGKDGVKRNWLATWRNWVRRDRDAPQAGGKGSPPVPPQPDQRRKPFPFGGAS